MLHDGTNQARLAFSLERSPPGHHFIEHRSEGKNVRAAVRFLPLELLGGHVLKRAEDGAFRGQGSLLSGQRRVTGTRTSLCEFGEAGIQELRPRLGEHDVAGLEIPMHHTLPVGFVQRIRNFDGVAKRLVERQCAFLQAVRQSLAFDVLHHHEVDAVLAADVVERADVRMIQTGDGTGLALESLFEPGVIGEVRRKNLDGNRAVESSVFRFVDLT